jgi:hypothetical protein
MEVVRIISQILRVTSGSVEILTSGHPNTSQLSVTQFSAPVYINGAARRELL